MCDGNFCQYPLGLNLVGFFNPKEQNKQVEGKDTRKGILCPQKL